MDSRLGEGTSRCQTVCPWAVRWSDALGAVPGRPWDGIWHTGDVIGHTRDVLGRPVDGRIVPRTSTGQWTHYGRSTESSQLPVFIVCVYMLLRYRPEKVNPPIPKKENNGLSVFNVVYLLYVTQYVCCVISRDTDKLSWLLLMAWSLSGIRPSTTNKRCIQDSQSNVAPFTKNMLQMSAFINTLWKTFN